MPKVRVRLIEDFTHDQIKGLVQICKQAVADALSSTEVPLQPANVQVEVCFAGDFDEMDGNSAEIAISALNIPWRLRSKKEISESIGTAVSRGIPAGKHFDVSLSLYEGHFLKGVGTAA